MAGKHWVLCCCYVQQGMTNSCLVKPGMIDSLLGRWAWCDGLWHGLFSQVWLAVALVGESGVILITWAVEPGVIDSLLGRWTWCDGLWHGLLSQVWLAVALVGEPGVIDSPGQVNQVWLTHLGRWTRYGWLTWAGEPGVIGCFLGRWTRCDWLITWPGEPGVIGCCLGRWTRCDDFTWAGEPGVMTSPVHVSQVQLNESLVASGRVFDPYSVHQWRERLRVFVRTGSEMWHV